MTNKPFWYLATPFQKYKDGLEAAHKDACIVAGKFMNAGIHVFCPIAHCYNISKVGGPSHMHENWLDLDKPFIDAAQGIIVVKMPGWDKSYGVDYEIKQFVKAGKIVLYMDWEEVDTYIGQVKMFEENSNGA